jgi:anti-sigma regulatory factor (Ser/Thr protein kinase)
MTCLPQEVWRIGLLRKWVIELLRKLENENVRIDDCKTEGGEDRI